MKIALIGPMASGKSTLGVLLAEKLKLTFFDTDVWVEQQTGLSITQLFQQQSEIFFRTAETRALEDILKQENGVIATGGGIILKSSNRTLLAQHTTVIYLNVSIETQLERTKNDSSRPLLQTGNKEQVLSNLQQQRDPLYREIAHHIIQVDDKTAPVLIEEIGKRVEIQQSR